MAGSFFKPSEETTDGFRLIRLVKDGGTHVLRELFDSIHPAANLPQVLKNNHARLKATRVIFKSQWDMLFPASGNPDSKNFDITLLHLLLREICNLTAPSTGWNKMPADSDVSREANIARIKYFRNELCHSVAIGVTKTQFEDKWKRISSALVALGLDQKDVDPLKSEPIDHDIERLEKEVEDWKLDIESRLEILEQKSKQDQSSIELPSFLPDKVPNVFGREKVIKQVTQDIRSGTVAAVVITGGPGFGKTTVAKEVAHELAKNVAIEQDRTVLFCRLRSKETVDEVATEMILHCGKIYSQLPNDPEHNLKQWSQQLNSLKEVQKKVTFVLDNADDVLESKDRQKFVSILKNMRTLSGQRLTFLITCRNFFRDPDLQMKETRMPYLSDENAKKVLTSRVSDQEILTTLSEIDELAKLCRGVPLALHIVGRHLSYIKQDTLIKSLKEKPLAILEEGVLSVKRTIEASFYLLSKREQEALVLLSLFPGSFDSEAAEAVIRATAEADYDIILLPLVKGPLVEKSGPYRYEIHPFIQHFLKIIGQSEPSRLELLDRARRLACTHFMSCIAENAGMYWSKDKCKKSIEAFNKDRNNFEYFLQMYAQGRENQDQEIVGACKAFMEDLPEKCLYLEMCVLPKFYTSFLKRLLETFSLDHEPVHRVEILCLLGHESRKKGDQQKYKELMDEAEQIHSKLSAEFERNPLSEVFFRNSCVRFLSFTKDPSNDDRIQREIEIALKVSSEELGDHPHTAVTLKYAGMFVKSRTEERIQDDERMLKKALHLFQKCLGKHLLTAICLKDIADLYFVDWRKKGLDTCLKQYEDTFAMFEDLEMDGSKVTILTLKNFAICHRKKGNFDQAMKLLTKAAKVAELELEEDHKWKVLIKTEFAFLHDEMGNQQQAIDEMKEGLLMKDRLDLPMAKLENCDKIQEFVARFPNENFPGTAKKKGCQNLSPTPLIAKRKTDESLCIDKKRRKNK